MTSARNSSEHRSFGIHRDFPGTSEGFNAKSRICPHHINAFFFCSCRRYIYLRSIGIRKRSRSWVISDRQRGSPLLSPRRSIVYLALNSGRARGIQPLREKASAAGRRKSARRPPGSHRGRGRFSGRTARRRFAHGLVDISRSPMTQRSMCKIIAPLSVASDWNSGREQVQLGWRCR